jgi:hypothetical protein
MNELNKKNLLSSFKVLFPCPNCHNPPTGPFGPWTKSQFNRTIFSPARDNSSDHYIKYEYCGRCILTPEQVTQVKAFFNE